MKGKVDDFKVLDKDVPIPLPKPRPKDYDSHPKSATPTYFEQAYIDRSPPGKMASVGFFINPVLGILGLIIAMVGLVVFHNMIAVMVGFALCLAGIIHIVIQLRDEELRSTMLFNRGVRLFNRERYRKAEQIFRRALTINPDNELARHGVRKAKTYRR
jgi:tetratricopeptide (TPR) repeat protein